MNKLRNSLVSGQVPAVGMMEPGDIGVNNADGTIFVLKKNGTATSIVQIGGITSFNTRTGDIVLNSGDVTAALGYVPVQPNSPTFTGTPTAPTATLGASTKQLATTEFVTKSLASYVPPTPTLSLDGLSDVSVTDGAGIDGYALTYSNAASTWIASKLATVAFSGKYADLTGTPTSTVTSFNTRTGAITLTSADVTSAGGALLASPAFTGNPTAPTPTAGDNDTSIATTAFVSSAIAASLQVGADGQVGFLNGAGSTVEYDEIVKLGKFISSDAELTSAESTVISQQTIFNTWYRFSHNTSGTYPANSSELTSWSYNTSNDTISSTLNSTTYIGFVSQKSYANYTHEVTVSSTATDDDDITVVIAFATDANGKEYTLSAVRTRNGGPASAWSLYYNLSQTGAWQIVNGDTKAPGAGAGQNWNLVPTGSRIRVVRAGDSIKVFCSQFNSTTIDLSTELDIDLTSDPRLAIFRGPQRYGYGAYSQLNATFANVYFSDTANIIYDVRDNSVYTANSSGTWTKDTSSTLVTRIGFNRLLYNTTTSSLYWVDPSSQAAIKISTGTTTGTVTSFNTRSGDVTLVSADITGAGGALLASPALTGTPTAPTATAGTNTTQLATTAFVTAAITAGAGVTAFNTRTGAVTLTSADITSASGALLASPTFTGSPKAPTPTAGDSSTLIATTAFVANAVTASNPDLSGYAPLASPTFTGTPKGPTATAGTNTTQLATTAFVTAAVTASNPDLSGYAPKASPALTGTPTAPTATAGTNTTQLATTAFVTAAVTAGAGVTTFNTRSGAVTLASADITGAGGALLASPTFTGIPAAPTAATGTNTTQLATTAFVAASKYYDVSGGAPGSITASQVICFHVAARTLSFASAFAGSKGYALTAPAASTTFTIAVNGTTVGTMVFAASANTPTFTTSSGAFTVTPGQYITVMGPASADANLANVSFTLLSLAT